MAWLMDWWMSVPCVNSLRSTHAWTQPPGAPGTLHRGYLWASCWRHRGWMIDEDVWAQIDHQIISKSIWCNAVINPMSYCLSYWQDMSARPRQSKTQTTRNTTQLSARFHFQPDFLSPLVLWAEVNFHRHRTHANSIFWQLRCFDFFLFVFTWMWCVLATYQAFPLNFCQDVSLTWANC